MFTILILFEIMGRKKKYTIEDMGATAEAKGGKCLSETYINNATPLLWECSKKHQWYAQPQSILNIKTWCPLCSKEGMRKGLEEMKKLASERAGECLSTSYANEHTHLLWRCSLGHRWRAMPRQIVQGSWCPKCAILNRFRAAEKIISIEDMQELAESKGGKCLSDTYINTQVRLTWMCSQGHIWKARPFDIKRGRRGSWCAICAGVQKLTIEDMQALAEAKGGRCLSKAYVNNVKLLSWECSKGHIWRASPRNVKVNGSWCRRCAYDSYRRRTP